MYLERLPSMDDNFRQYSTFNQDMFLRYLKELQRKFRKLILFLDTAANTTVLVRSENIWKGGKVLLKLNELPKGFHLGRVLLKNAGLKEKMNFLCQDIIPNFEIWRRLLQRTDRTKRFRLDITNYLLRR